MNEAENSSYCNLCDSLAQAYGCTVMSIQHTAHLCCDFLGTATLGMAPCDIVISLMHLAQESLWVV